MCAVDKSDNAQGLLQKCENIATVPKKNLDAVCSINLNKDALSISNLSNHNLYFPPDSLI